MESELLSLTDKDRKIDILQLNSTLIMQLGKIKVLSFEFMQNS